MEDGYVVSILIKVSGEGTTKQVTFGWGPEWVKGVNHVDTWSKNNLGNRNISYKAP